jgi:hypothetical protein
MARASFVEKSTIHSFTTKTSIEIERFATLVSKMKQNKLDDCYSQILRAWRCSAFIELFGLYFLLVEQVKVALRQLLCVKPMHRAFKTTKAAFNNWFEITWPD